MPKTIATIVSGQRFSRLTVIEPLQRGVGQRQKYKCLCDCGKEVSVVKYALILGNTKSCGCWRVDVAKRLGNNTLRHGDAGTHWNGQVVDAKPEYRVWTSMIQRCTRETHESYPNYGGRGIKVCQRWIDSYSNFLSDVGRRPSPIHSLDRKDNNLGYFPENVKWSTPAEQVRNSRVAKNVTLNGETKCITDWAAKLGLRRQTVYLRLSKGWSIEDAFRPSIRKNIHPFVQGEPNTLHREKGSAI